jgi:hypothetical protein
MRKLVGRNVKRIRQEKGLTQERWRRFQASVSNI